MSSLLALVRKKGVRVPKELLKWGPEQLLEWQKLAEKLGLATRNIDLVLVNAQSVALRLSDPLITGPTMKLFEDFEDATPCFSKMWFEFQKYGRKLAVFVDRDHRIPAQMIEGMQQIRSGYGKPFSIDEKITGIRLLAAGEFEGQPIIICMTEIALDDLGQVLGMASASPVGRMKEESTVWRVMHTLVDVVLETITSINTEGTTVSPPWPHMSNTPVKPNPRRPCSTWHTIHIGGHEPHSQSFGKSIMREAEDRREHWVRAHRKDYRKGAGLFGRVKKLIWVHEHKRGDKELGTIIPEYVVR